MTGLFSYPKRRLRKMIRNGEYAEAARYGESIRGDHEGDHDFMFIMGSIYYMVEDYQKALVCFEEADVLGPGDVEMLKLKANTHLALGQAEDAAECCRSILRADPRDDEAGVLLKKLGG